MVFKKLSETEETKYREYARTHEPENMDFWDIYHPICRQEWLKRGIGVDKPVLTYLYMQESEE